MSAPSAAASPAAASARKDLGLRALDGAFACHPTLPLTVLTLVIRMSRLRPEHRALIVYNWQTQQIVGTSTSLLGPPPKEDDYLIHHLTWFRPTKEQPVPDQFLAVTDQGSVRLCTCEGITTLGRGSVRVEREVAIVVHQAARSRSRGISLNSNNSLLCIPNLSLNQSIVDLQTGKQVLALPKEFYATQFSRADPYTLYGLKEEQAHFYSVDLRSHRARNDQTVLQGPVTGWIAETWELRPKPLFQLSGVHALALSPNGRHVAVCDQVDSSVRVWDLNAGCFVYESVPLSPGSTKKDPFWCCSFTHDSQHIIVWERNGSMLHLLSMRERGIVQSSSLTLKKNHIGRAASFLISHVEPCSSSNQLICQDEDGELQHVQFPGGTAGMGGNRGDPIEIDREGGAPLESPRITPSSGSIPRREPPPPSAFRPLDLEQNLAAIAAAYPEFNRAPASADAAGGRAPSLEPSIFTSRPTAAAASSSSSSAPVSSAAPMPSLSSAGRRLGAPLVKQEEHRLEEQLKDKSAVKVARARKRKAEETAVHLREKAARLEEQKHAAEDEADHERQMRVHTERDVRREKRARGVEREQLVEARVKAEEVIEQIAEERDAAMEDRDRFEQEMQRARELSAAPSCSVCQDAPPSVLFLSCNHLTVCRPCNLELMNNRGEGPKRCPICRKAVVGELPVVIP